jgi:hypothetical protein
MADGLLTQGLNYIDQQKQALAARLGLLMNNPQEFAAQLGSEARQRAGVGLLGEPKTAQEMASGAWINSPYGQQAMQAGSGFAGNIKPVNPTFEEFKQLLSTGKLNFAKNREQELKDLYSGKSKFAEINLNWEDPKTYDFEEKLLSKGYKTKLLNNRSTVIFKNPEDIAALESAQNPAQYGFAYGYSPNDIARFYWERRNAALHPDAANLAYKEWLKDTKK